MSVNKIILLGRVGKDPEFKRFDGGSKASFSVATTERGYTTKNGISVPEKTEWHNIVCWKGLATIVEMCVKKGDLIYIEGKITTRSWESDGKRHYMTEIVADNIELLGNKSEKTEKDPFDEPPMGEKVGRGGINDNGDLPF
jgi:single-strand DNA-binding protein